MGLPPILDLILLEHQKELKRIILETANTFFLFLKIPKIPLKMTYVRIDVSLYSLAYRVLPNKSLFSHYIFCLINPYPSYS